MNPDMLVRELAAFEGACSRLDAENVPVNKALLAQNVSYTRGQVATRYGHSAMFTVSPWDAAWTSMYNWLLLYLGANHNWLVWYAAGVGVRQMDLDQLAWGATTLIPQTTAYAAWFAGAGSRLYVAYYDSHGVGMAGGNVYAWGVGADPLFAGPMASTFSGASEPAAGVVTAGIHRFGYLLQTRNGFTTTWCPVSSGAFAPYSFNASGGKTLRLSMTANLPTWASQLQIIMTTADNLDRYFVVPGAVMQVPGGVNGWPFNFPDISIADEDLANCTDAASFANRLTCDINGTPPFFPSVIFPYSGRMGYITRDGAGYPVCYFSDPSDFQSLDAATSGVYLPGNLPMVAGAALRGVGYLFGPHWSYAVTDNGQVPAEWAEAQLVDGSIGTLSPTGVCLSAAQGFLWVADESGLYCFQGGVYPSLPVSYYQDPDWRRINWAAATAVSVVDDKNNKRVEVLAPLDGATAPTHRLAWDYTDYDGADPTTVKYSLNSLASYAMSAIAMVQNPTSKKMEVWTAPQTSNPVMRQNDGSETHPYRDGAAGIASTYESAPLPGIDATRGQVQFFHGNHARIKGAGPLALKVWGVDHVRSVVPAASPLTLAPAPGLELLWKYFLQSEYATLQLSTDGAADHYFLLSRLKQYYTKAAPQR